MVRLRGGPTAPLVPAQAVADTRDSDGDYRVEARYGAGDVGCIPYALLNLEQVQWLFPLSDRPVSGPRPPLDKQQRPIIRSTAKPGIETATIEFCGDGSVQIRAGKLSFALTPGRTTAVRYTTQLAQLVDAPGVANCQQLRLRTRLCQLFRHVLEVDTGGKHVFTAACAERLEKQDKRGCFRSGQIVFLADDERGFLVGFESVPQAEQFLGAVYGHCGLVFDEGTRMHEGLYRRLCDKQQYDKCGQMNRSQYLSAVQQITTQVKQNSLTTQDQFDMALKNVPKELGEDWQFMVDDAVAVFYGQYSATWHIERPVNGSI